MPPWRVISYRIGVVPSVHEETIATTRERIIRQLNFENKIARGWERRGFAGGTAPDVGKRLAGKRAEGCGPSADRDRPVRWVLSSPLTQRYRRVKPDARRILMIRCSRRTPPQARSRESGVPLAGIDGRTAEVIPEEGRLVCRSRRNDPCTSPGCWGNNHHQG